jgi:hypothetical protein
MLVEGVLDTLAARYDLVMQELDGPREDIAFKLPRVLADPVLADPEPARP